MADLKETKNKLMEDCSIMDDSKEKIKTADDSQLSEDELEDVSGGVLRNYPVKDKRMI